MNYDAVNSVLLRVQQDRAAVPADIIHRLVYLLEVWRSRGRRQIGLPIREEVEAASREKGEARLGREKAAYAALEAKEAAANIAAIASAAIAAKKSENV